MGRVASPAGSGVPTVGNIDEQTGLETTSQLAGSSGTSLGGPRVQ